MSFDSIIMVDWSGGNDSGPTPKKDAIWACVAQGGMAAEPVYLRNRAVAEDWITKALKAELAAGRRCLIGFDLCFAYPKGFATQLIGREDTLALWDWFEARVEDSPKANNRFDLAGTINGMFPGTGPYWFGLHSREIANLPRKGKDREGHGLPEKRAADKALKGAFSPWQLGGAGAVGGQVIMGMPTLARLRRRFGRDLSVWPFQPADTAIVLAETYFSQFPLPPDRHAIKDAAQVQTYAERFSALDDAAWAQLLDHPADPEGWVLGAGHPDVLTGDLTPPALTNDCFAMPQGAHWTPVEDALAHLRANLAPVTATETLPITEAAGRVLAVDVTAKRSHPPAPNAAVDGYGFAGPAGDGLQQMPLVAGRAAAGAPYGHAVPAGHAIRILTGANLPAGVDTVILQEDVAAGDDAIAFNGPLKKGANARNAGEDMQAGQAILTAGTRLTPRAIGTAVAAGAGDVITCAPLTVGVLSTGDELRQPGQPAGDGDIFDANRPMLLAEIANWGYQPRDLGCGPDNRPALRDILTKAAQTCDVILTSGGASGGDEDHMSALLQDTGSFALWRIAMKPGRPLAMGLWDGTPVLGLPGNPVAAFVCAQVFAAPACALLAGLGWQDPQRFTVPAGFAKSKKAGRTEYLRARITDGRAEVFASEGSGRISGLHWATGLVELPHDAISIAPGDPVIFRPFSGVMG